MSLGGVLICLVGILISVIALYQKIGLQIFFVHVDSLGHYLYSPLAYVYNISLILAGGSFFLAMLSLFLLGHNRFTLVLAISGAITGVSVAFLGIYPSNEVLSHHITVVLFASSTLFMFCLLVIGKIKYPELCQNWSSINAVCGVLITGIYLTNLDPVLMLTHTCPPISMCPLARLSGLHTLVTLLGGISLAMLAKSLLKQSQAMSHSSFQINNSKVVASSKRNNIILF